MPKAIGDFFKVQHQIHSPHLALVSGLRYGENQRLRAELYRLAGDDPLSFRNFAPVGKLNLETDVSMIALTDLDRGIRTALLIAATGEVNRFDDWNCVAVGMKHGNACGAAIGKTPIEALVGMIEGDSRALFGGSVVMNFPLDIEGADLLHHHNCSMGSSRVIAGVAAPGIDPEAHEELRRKSRALIAFENPALAKLGMALIPKKVVYRHLPILNAIVVQEADSFVLNLDDERIRTEWTTDHFSRNPFADKQTRRDIALAQAVCWTSNSNTITLAAGDRILVNSVGGQDRVGACEVAGYRLRSKHQGCCGISAASDSFFPFYDGLLTLKSYGVERVFTTQGGERERQVAEYARENGLALMWIPDKIARGFFGHG